jgi:hypothetical protein
MMIGELMAVSSQKIDAAGEYDYTRDHDTRA